MSAPGASVRAFLGLLLLECGFDGGCQNTREKRTARFAWLCQRTFGLSEYLARDRDRDLPGRHTDDLTKSSHTSSYPSTRACGHRADTYTRGAARRLPAAAGRSSRRCQVRQDRSAALVLSGKLVAP